MALKKPKKNRKIRVTVEFGYAGISTVEEYYDLPEDWDSLPVKDQENILEDYGATELSNCGVGYGASVVEVY